MHTTRFRHQLRELHVRGMMVTWDHGYARTNGFLMMLHYAYFLWGVATSGGHRVKIDEAKIEEAVILACTRRTERPPTCATAGLLTCRREARCACARCECARCECWRRNECARHIFARCCVSAASDADTHPCAIDSLSYT